MVKLRGRISLWFTARVWTYVHLDRPLTVDGLTYSGHVMRRREGERIVHRQASAEEILEETWFWAIK